MKTDKNSEINNNIKKRSQYRGDKGIVADICIILQETKYIILILNIMIQ